MVGQRVGLRTIMRRSVGRGGSAGGRRLRLPLGLVGLRRLRGRVARGVDWAVFALVASGGDGWVMRAGCLGVTGLGGKGADLLGRGWGLLLGASANHVWTRPPGSALRVRGSYRQMDRTIPLGRRGGRDLTGWAALLCAELGYNLRLHCGYLDPTTQTTTNTTTTTSTTQARLLSLCSRG